MKAVTRPASAAGWATHESDERSFPCVVDELLRVVSKSARDDDDDDDDVYLHTQDATEQALYIFTCVHHHQTPRNRPHRSLSAV